jgi:hypothetical protein
VRGGRGLGKEVLDRRNYKGKGGRLCHDAARLFAAKTRVYLVNVFAIIVNVFTSSIIFRAT